jgi:hypothetical protein
MPAAAPALPRQRVVRPERRQGKNDVPGTKVEGETHSGSAPARAITTHSFLAAFRRLVTRWDYHIENFLGFVHQACYHLTAQTSMRPVLVIITEATEPYTGSKYPPS